MKKKREREELAFYRSLTVSREEGVTAVDGNRTAQKLHELWEERDQLRERMERLAEYHGLYCWECQHGSKCQTMRIATGGES